jgi:hypothetical protein
MLHLSQDLHCIFTLHYGAWRGRRRPGDAKKNFWEDLERVGKTFFLEHRGQEELDSK